MSKNTATTPKDPVIPDKIRSSLVLKLNLKMAGILIAAFFLMNFFISILYFSTTLWRAEQSAEDLLTRYGQELSLTEDTEIFIGSYHLRFSDTEPEGNVFFSTILHWLPFPLDDSIRSFSLAQDPSGEALFSRLERARYDISIPVEGGFHHVTYTLERDFHVFFFILIVLIILEFLYLLVSLKNNRNSIRRVLRPLSQLAETTNKLRAGLDSDGRITDQKDLEDLARVISGFDTTKMGKGIPLEQTQNELKDLAGAINEMLHRINQSYEAQVRFVSDASHELRTPIAVIQGYANLLDRWGKNDPKTLDESIHAIKSETENMQNLVEQLLFLARGDSENLPLQPEVMNLSEVGTMVIREAKLIDSKHPFQINAVDNVYLKGDPQLIKQAIRILVDNSIKYTPEGDEILLRIYYNDQKAYIQVQDQGEGMQPEVVPRIFDRFYRSESARGGTASGAGLGLSIAKWIIEKHQGNLEVLSREGIGTRITIELPEASLNDKSFE